MFWKQEILRKAQEKTRRHLVKEKRHLKNLTRSKLTFSSLMAKKGTSLQLQGIMNLKKQIYYKFTTVVFEVSSFQCNYNAPLQLWSFYLQWQFIQNLLILMHKMLCLKVTKTLSNMSPHLSATHYTFLHFYILAPFIWM